MGRWTDLASNRWIAKADVQDAINTSLVGVVGSAPSISSEQFISRDELTSWVNVSGAQGVSTQYQVKGGLTLYPPDPATSTLTITFASNRFTATLSSPIPSTLIQIYAHSVLGYSTTVCSEAEEGGVASSYTNWDKETGGSIVISPLEVIAGQYSGIQDVEGMTCGSIRYKLGATCNVNGTARNNGATFTVGGTTVTLVIDPTACSVYTC